MSHTTKTWLSLEERGGLEKVNISYKSALS